MRGLKFLLTALGIGLLAWLLWRLGPGPVLDALAHAGWGGLALVLAGGILLTFCLSTGLYPFVLGQISPLAMLAARQVRDSSGDILPITQVGGMVVGTRALVLAGLAAPRAAAVLLADVTTELLAQSLFILAGLGLAAPAMAADPHWAPYIGWIAGGAVLFALANLAFAIAQLAGSHWAEKMLKPAAFGIHASAFRDAVHGIYGRRGALALSVLLHMFGWAASGAWLWLVFRVLGHPVPFAVAFAIQALLEGLRSATVFIPAAIGVQEIGYASLAPLFGLPAQVGLAVSLLRRARDIAIGVPVLLLWQLVEARRAAARYSGVNSR